MDTKDMTPERAEAILEASEEGAPEVVDAEFTEETSDEQPQLPEPPPLEIGYVVGMTKDGNFVFELLGENRGLVQLLGIHEHAKRRVTAIYDDNQMMGDRLVHEVGKATGACLQAVEQLVKQQKGPDNKI